MKTILQISKELGLDKQKVYRTFKKHFNDTDNDVVLVDGAIHLNDVAESKLISKLGLKLDTVEAHQESTSKAYHNMHQKSHQSTSEAHHDMATEKLISMLEKELENKQDIINALINDKSVMSQVLLSLKAPTEKLTIALDEAHNQLSEKDIIIQDQREKIKALEEKLKDQEQGQPIATEEKSKNIFRKLFNK